MTKTCKQSKKLGCGRTLDISLFNKNGDYVQSYCKSCTMIYRNTKKMNTQNPAEVARSMCNKLLKV